MLRSWKLCTAFGIGIYVHWSFLLLMGAVLFVSWTSGESVLIASAMMFLIFGCVVLHELGHALTARTFGIQTRDITLLPIGGVARLERMSEKPWEEFCIAIAGPAVNVAIVTLLLGVTVVFDRSGSVFRNLAALLGSLFSSRDPGVVLAQLSPGMLLWVYLIFLNMMLVIFNMIPAFPMDGGRVLRALLTSAIGHRPATEAAVTLGMAIAVGMVLSGLRIVSLPFPGNGSPMLLLVGMFVFFAGQQELYMVRQRDAQRRTAGSNGLMPGPFIRPSTTVPPEPNFDGFTFDRQHHVWIEWRQGRPVHASWAPSE